MPLTVGQLALLAAKPGKRGALIERIRHWTREGLIRPLGEKNPGTGRHRRYEEYTLAEVAILNALADLGVQVAGQHAMLLAAAEKCRSIVHKLVSRLNKPDRPKRLKSSTEMPLKSARESTIIFLEITNFNGTLNVKEHYAKHLTRGMYLPIQMPNADASLFINMTRVLWWIATRNSKRRLEAPLYSASD